MLTNLLYVGLGGFAGSCCRYLISRYVALHQLSSFPYGTFLVNIAGCFIIGLIYGLAAKNLTSSSLQLLLATGFCGGFTTFSSFSLETFALLQDGQLWYAFLYSAGSLLLGLAAVWVAITVTKSMT